MESLNRSSRSGGRHLSWEIMSLRTACEALIGGSTAIHPAKMANGNIPYHGWHAWVMKGVGQ